MEIRRVQMTGGSSYVLTLPKEWVQSLHIRKKDPLGVMIKENGDLVITGNVNEDFGDKEKLMEINSEISHESFFRSLVGSYIGGFNSIEIRSTGRIPALIRRAVRDFSDQVIGLEIIEESDERILLRDLFNPLELPFEQSLKRMYVIAQRMHLDLSPLLTRHDNSLIQDIILRDRDVDRLFWLISRQTNIILNSSRSINRKNIPFVQVLHYFQAGRIIERIADHAVLIAMGIQNLNQEHDFGKIGVAVEAALQEALKAFDKSIAAFFTDDILKANRIIETVHLHEDTFHTINTDILHLSTDTALAIRKISDSIRRVGEYSGDIAEEVINYHTGLENEER